MCVDDPVRVFRYDGANWSMPYDDWPFFWLRYHFFDEENAVAIGMSSFGGTPARIGRWNGSEWTMGPPGVEIAGDGILWDLWGNEPDDVYSVGTGGTVIHSVGDSWELLEAVTPNCLTGIWGLPSGEMWVVGEVGTVLHFEGGEWETLDFCDDGYFGEIRGNDAGVVYVLMAGNEMFRRDPG